MSNTRGFAPTACGLRLLAVATCLLPFATLATSPVPAQFDEEAPLKSWTAVPRDRGAAATDEFELRALRPPLLHLQVTSPFGERLNPVMRRKVFHKGVDYGAPTGTPVYAAQFGTVEAVGMQDHSGIYVRLRHSQRVETIYAHLHRIMPGLHRGSILRGGDILGFVGSSGFTTGPHLHYEVLLGGKPVNPDLCRNPLRPVSRNEP
jgi:murein DD-endopeptidase MepM/ murein hydrolase activator NlpD